MNAISEQARPKKCDDFVDHHEDFIESLRKHPEDLDVYVNVALENYEEEKHIPYLLLSLRNIAEAKKIDLPQLTDPQEILTRTSLDLAELREILNALGYRLSAKPVDTAKSK